MIDNTPLRYFFIRVSILCLQYAPYIDASLVVLVRCLLKLFPYYADQSLAWAVHHAALGALCLELAYLAAIYLPHKARLAGSARHPPPQPRRARERLFRRCIVNVPDRERYQNLWFLGAPKQSILRDNVRQLVLWAFFDSDDIPYHGDGGRNSNEEQRLGTEATCKTCDSRCVCSEGGQPVKAAKNDGAAGEDIEAELNSYIGQCERFLGRTFAPGKGPARALRLTIDAVDARYRSVLWYGVIALLDFATHLGLVWGGFVYYAPPLKKALAIFPPRLQALPSLVPLLGLGDEAETGEQGLLIDGTDGEDEQQRPRAEAINKASRERGWWERHRSPSGEFGYWFRPHRSRTRRPVVFLHGIGIGLYPYVRFFAELNRPQSCPPSEADGRDGDGDEIGILAVEILPVSSRLTAPLVRRERFLAEMRTILDAHLADGWDEFVLVSHSYGSVLTTHVLHCAELRERVKAVVLVDPVSVMLHLPDVAYNFTRRVPHTAAEWQLWYFASMDLGIAEGLGRHFFWRENVVWRDELLGIDDEATEEVAEPHEERGDGDGESGVFESESFQVVTRSLSPAPVAAPTARLSSKPSRKVAVCLSGRDLIVDTRTVARYLACEGNLSDADAKVCQGGVELDFLRDRKADTRASVRRHVASTGVEILWYPLMDHAQIFESKRDRRPVVEVIRRYSVRDEVV